ncbi:MAG: methionyl-tRNA formyltransferase [Planctomycetota bacterium]|jgi:methionyl-tRNA formyltransferase
MRYIFMGSPPFAMPVFEALLDSGHVLLALVTRPDKPRGRGREVVASDLVKLARSRDIPVLQPETTKTKEFVEELRSFQPDVLLAASYGEILREEVLNLAPHGALNVHGSLLPRHRGAAPIQQAVAMGDAQTGVSIQRMVLALDEGDLLLSSSIPIGPEDTSGDLFDSLAKLGGEVAVQALDMLDAGEDVYTPQDESLATYARKLKKSDGCIDWNMSAVSIERHTRAMQPWPGAKAATPDGRPLIVQSARIDSTHAGTPGELLETAKRCLVATGEGALELLIVKPAGKRAMDAGSWLRGSRLESGARLGNGGDAQ